MEVSIMSKRGRPAVLDDIKKSEVLAILSTGCNRWTAAKYVNCSPKTIYNAAQRDPRFAKELARLERQSEIVHLGNLNVIAKKPAYWRASAWMLERLFPDRFGRQPEDLTPGQSIEPIMAALKNGMQKSLASEPRKSAAARLVKTDRRQSRKTPRRKRSR
jgi:hypothetical protein